MGTKFLNGGCYDIAKRKWKKHFGIRPIGTTVDGKVVMRGLDVFKVSEALGVPLDIILEHLQTQNQVVDWVDFIITSLDHGWQIKTTMNKIEYTISDVYGKKYCEEVMVRIKWYVTTIM